MTTHTFKTQLVKLMPKTIEEGILYVSEMYEVAIHLCVCGCGERVVTPLNKGQWSVVYSGDTVTLTPSIGNFNFKCKSHYYITENKVKWL